MRFFIAVISMLSICIFFMVIMTSPFWISTIIQYNHQQGLLKEGKEAALIGIPECPYFDELDQYWWKQGYALQEYQNKVEAKVLK